MESSTGDWIDVTNPANGEVIARAPDSTAAEIGDAISAAESAFESWRMVPAVDRTQVLFRLKALMEEHIEDLSAVVTAENGKTLDESRGEIRRTIENVEVAIGVPSLMMGSNLENVATGIDEYAVRQPLGVFGMVPPFNFPAMVPMWFMPYAIACGNTYIIKPSEQTPMSQARIAELAVESGFPPGVLNVVHGGRSVSEALLEDPRIAGVSFVGSSSVAREVYRRGTAAGKRMQCQGGAKNYLVVMPDASMEETVDNVLGSAFGAAGQRCLAGSVVVTVGEAHDALTNGVVDAAKSVKVGDGTEPDTEMGPVISSASRDRVTNYIEKGLEEGATLLLDGRNADGGDGGYFVGPTIFADVDPSMAIAREEIFGPVLSVMRADSLDEAYRDHRPRAVREHGVDLYVERQGRQRVQLTSQSGQRGSQHRRGGAHGLLPLWRYEGVVLRRLAWSGPATQSTSLPRKRLSSSGGSSRPRRVPLADEGMDVGLITDRAGPSLD